MSSEPTNEKAIAYIKELRDKGIECLTREKLLSEEEQYYGPYCMCDTMGRMTRTKTGFKCEGKGDWAGRRGCGKSFEFDEEFLELYEEVHGVPFEEGIGKKIGGEYGLNY